MFVNYERNVESRVSFFNRLRRLHQKGDTSALAL